jgi:hypothetical protein
MTKPLTVLLSCYNLDEDNRTFMNITQIKIYQKENNIT